MRQGDAVSITVIRDRKPVTLRATMTSAPAPGADARPPWLDDWFDDMRRRFRQPDWLEEMLRPWQERGPGRGGERSTQT
jgi:hypothetical protein